VPYDCFISYASADLALAEALHRRLEAAGLSVWFDRARLQPGYDWHREIEQACESSRVVLPILTPRWKRSEWTRYETYGAEHIIPLLAEGRWEEVATPPLARFQHHSFAASDDALIGAIRERLAQPAPDKAPRVAHLRYRPNPYFVGRDATLTEIHEKLHRNPTAALTQGRVEAVTALGGVGKTTIAREYAEKFWRCYRQMLWVDCRVGLEAEFAGLLEYLIDQPVDPQSKQADRADRARRELNRHDPNNPRLLILDNAEDEESVTPWIPRTGNCHTLITSRFTAWSPGIEQYPVWVLEPGPARELLRLRAGREGEGSEFAACDELAKKLGYLPLALEQAGAYVGKQGLGFSFADYLELYAKAEHELLAKPARGSTEYPAAVYTTWRTTVDKLPADARTMLRLSAFLAPAPIPFRMFVEGRAEWPGESQPSEFTLREWKDALLDYSMVTPQPDDSFTLHPLVQAVERHQVDQSERGRWLDRAARLVWLYGPSPSDEYANWPVWKVLAPHGLVLYEQLEGVDCSEAAARLFNEVALYAGTQGDFGAEPLYLRALEALERLLGREHPNTLTAVNNLAGLLWDMGDYDAAEPLLRSALASCERVLGIEHPDTLGSVNNLAELLRTTGDYAAAEPLHRRALEAYERVLGPEHPDTLGSVNNLALLLHNKGDYAAAEPLFRRALEAQERLLGREHPATLQSVNNLALLLYNKGDYAAAEPLYRRALEARERLLGRDHPDTLGSVNNLAALLYSKGDDAVAESLFRRALEAQERVLGHEHPATLQSVNNLAGLLHSKGDYAATEPLFRRALEARERLLGREHPDTLGSVNNLAALLYSKGDDDAAEPLLRRALEAQERLLGREHPNTQLIRSNLEQLLRETGRQ
jgi:tetratricopeptide (TPR) repeat protein